MLEINGGCLIIEGFSDKSRSWLVGKMEHPFGRGINLQIKVQNVQLLYQNFKKQKYPIFLDLEEMCYRVNDQKIGH